MAIQEEKYSLICIPKNGKKDSIMPTLVELGDGESAISPLEVITYLASNNYILLGILIDPNQNDVPKTVKFDSTVVGMIEILKVQIALGILEIEQGNPDLESELLTYEKFQQELKLLGIGVLGSGSGETPANSSPTNN